MTRTSYAVSTGVNFRPSRPSVPRTKITFRNIEINDAVSGQEDRWKEARNSVPPRQRKKRVMLPVPSGLVVSSDDEVRRKLAQVLRQCALAPVLASTVAESGMVLAGHEIAVVVCNDRMDDGKYEDIVKLVVRSETKAPVIVVTRTGEQPEYLAAMCGGVFDYLVYPPIHGDLQETIRNCSAGAAAAPQRRRDMGIKPVAVLLVGEGARNSLQLLRWLNQRGCRCQVAESCRGACNLVPRTQLDRSTPCYSFSAVGLA
jgi:ActR/RegA family two-component response regulator